MQSLPRIQACRPGKQHRGLQAIVERLSDFGVPTEPLHAKISNILAVHLNMATWETEDNVKKGPHEKPENFFRR